MKQLALVDPNVADPFELTAQDLMAISYAKKHRPTQSEIAKKAQERKMNELKLKVTEFNKWEYGNIHRCQTN
eukprot:gnl/Chilomastix_caulleri/7026.p1 GENE.gnl/Chilomastix_caulleri/7026~~gnl/Chilomastix_caulleri/7026.p1  ORF type:complete len:72 (+),score=15.89 gnl/Chilomastix_caulleri/7026:312-527(+)